MQDGFKEGLGEMVIETADQPLLPAVCHPGHRHNPDLAGTGGKQGPGALSHSRAGGQDIINKENPSSSNCQRIADGEGGSEIFSPGNPVQGCLRWCIACPNQDVRKQGVPCLRKKNSGKQQ